jgi:hypothetical protein
MYLNIKDKLLDFFMSDERILDLYFISNKKINKLVIELDNEYFLIDRRCPHQGLSLANATLSKDILICNWHGCSFSLFPNEIIPIENIMKHRSIDKTNFKWLKNELSS